MFKPIVAFISGVLLLFPVNPCSGQDSFDYSKIASHPRLLLTERDEKDLRTTLVSNRELKTIHDHIIGQSDLILVKDPMTYRKEGRRLLAVSRESLKRIFYLSYAYRMTEDMKYLEKAEQELNAVCGFADWNPSHFLDAGEMTMAVAIGYDWLFDVLRESTKEKIRRAIIEYGFEASEKYNRFLNMLSNWNQVCNSGLVYGALAIFEDHEPEAKAIIERALVTNRPVMDVCYAPDGNYPEGPGYWSYGTSFQVMMIAALESALGSDAGLSQHSGFQCTAEYMLFTKGPTGLSYNYSDCSTESGSNIPVFWFAAKQNRPELLFSEYERIKHGTFLSPFEESRLLPMVLVYARGIDFARITPLTRNTWSGHGLTPVVLVRTDWSDPASEYLGVKGGCAQVSHAHLDAGSFVYDSEGYRWVMDFGLQDYHSLESKGINIWNKTQNSQRWDIFRYNNRNHNTLTINDKNHDVHAKASLLEVYDSVDEQGGKFDLTEVFGGDVVSSVREVVIRDGSYLEVRDEIITGKTPATIRWTMVTPADVKLLDKKTIELRQGGVKKVLVVMSNADFELKIWPSEDPGTVYDAKNPGTVMIGFESVIDKNRTTIFTTTLKSGNYM